MTTKQRLKKLFDVVVEEMDSNLDFKEKVDSIFETERNTTNKKQKSKRNPSLINPYELIKQGEDILKTNLAPMDIEQLKDVILEHNMDSAKLAMKWKDKDRLISLIIDMANRRIAKGNVFLSE